MHDFAAGYWSIIMSALTSGLKLGSSERKNMERALLSWSTARRLCGRREGISRTNNDS